MTTDELTNGRHRSAEPPWLPSTPPSPAFASQVTGRPTLPSGTALTRGSEPTTQAASEADGEAIGEAAGEAANRDGNDHDNNPDGTLRRTRSKVWEHYTQVRLPGGTIRAKCHYCGGLYAISDSSTGNIWRHVNRAHLERVGDHELVDRTDEAPESPQIPPYSDETFREELVRLVVDDELPFCLVESPAFRRFCRYLNPRAKMPCANTICRDIGHQFKEEQARVAAVLRDAPGRLSFAVDAWTSRNAHSFLGITAHWIDAEWLPRHVLMDIPPLLGSHTGVNLCHTFTAACREFGVLPKLLAITTDNAKNNDTFLANLEDECQEQDISFDCESTHVRCAAHVINLAVQDFLKALNSAALDSDDADAEDYVADRTANGFISRLRKLVLKVRDSHKGRSRLAAQCTAANINAKGLVLDVKTRWNSTYAMVERALELREPLGITLGACKDLASYQLTDNEWQLLERVRPLLAAFKKATDHLCSDAHPTLGTAVPAYEFLFDRLDEYRDACRGLRAIRAATETAIETLERFYAKADAEVYAIATILDPRSKLQYYRNHGWEQARIDKAVDGLHGAYVRYCDLAAPSADECPPEDCDDMDLMEYAFGYESDKPDELEAYLAAPTVDRKANAPQWWKTNATTYPCLAAMARDYLAVPATGAPVERVFSDGADLVRPKRGSLSEKSIRESMCLKSWQKLVR
jgi:hAT family C-terminal dimerisation region/BED zinc finger